MHASILALPYLDLFNLFTPSPIVLGPGVVSSRMIDYLLSINGMIVSGTRGIEDACPLMICAAMHDGSATKQAWKTFQETFHHPSIPSSGLLAVYATL